MMQTGAYILITPAKNEEAYIEKTIQSVISQTIRPRKWVIVSDGSTDRTDEIIQSYAAQHDFITYLRADNKGYQGFASKVHAFNAGYKIINEEDYEFIGNLDADVSFDAVYFKGLIKEFSKNQKLGIGGGIIQELIGDKYVSQNISADSVAGAVQLFKKECFEKIGGYLPLIYGGVDAAAEIMARMHGWDVRTCVNLKVLHHRRVASSAGRMLRARFRQGRMYFYLGYHPLFQVMRCLYRIKDRPYIIGSVCMLWGYLWSLATKEKHALPDDVVSYLRSEQMRRLVALFGGKRLLMRKNT